MDKTILSKESREALISKNIPAEGLTMFGWSAINNYAIERLPLIVTQSERGQIGFKVFKASDVDPTYLIYSLIGLVLLISGVIFFTYQYKKWKKFKEFELELKALDLDSDHEGTLADMVRRYSLDEPVNILFSARLFDEMASVEMLRVLGSPGSLELKKEFIDKVYKIRTKTYHPEWLAAESKAMKNQKPIKNKHSDISGSHPLFDINHSQ